MIGDRKDDKFVSGSVWMEKTTLPYPQNKKGRKKDHLQMIYLTFTVPCREFHEECLPNYPKSAI